MQPWLLGVDAGGSRTQAALWQYGSETIFIAESGPGNPWTAGAEVAADAIEAACAHVLALGGMHLHEVSSAVVGIAGYGRSGAPPGFEDRIGAWGLPSGSVLTSDLDIATVAGLGGRSGIHVLAGTGSALMAQLDSGERIPFGGWGWFLGDAGSAFDLGRHAMRWWAASYDAGEPPRPLARRLAEWSGLDSPRKLQIRLSEPGKERPWIASGARVVLDLADAGDEDAGRVLALSVEGLVCSVRSASRKLSLQSPILLSFSGGMFQSRVFTDCYKSRLEAAGLQCEVVNTVSNPIEGALRIAEKSLNLLDYDNLKDVIALHYA